MVTKRVRDPHGTKANPTKALEPTLNVIDLPRRYFVGIVEAEQSEATKGVTGRQGTRAVYNLETAPAAVFDAFFQECNVTCKGTRPHLTRGPVNLDGVDRAEWDKMTRWWALNEVLERRGVVPLWESAEAAQAALHDREAVQREAVGV